MASGADANRCPAWDCRAIAREGGKVHPAMDTAISDIRAVQFAPGSDADSPVLPELPELPDQILGGEEIDTLTADGACDTPAPFPIIDPQATAIIPIRQNGRPWTQDCPAATPRNETLRTTQPCVWAF